MALWLRGQYTNKAGITALHNVLFVYSRRLSRRVEVSRSGVPPLNVAERTILELPWPPRRVLDISHVWLCGLIRSCSGVCRSDIVIMFSNRGTFQALCWLLIGLQCNDCVILMTQIQLIVIFMSCEDCLFPLWDCICRGLWVCVCVRQCVGVGNKGWSLCTAPLQCTPFVFLKSGCDACSPRFCDVGFPLFLLPLIWKKRAACWFKSASDLQASVAW